MVKMLVEVIEDRIGSQVAGLLVDAGLETIDDVLEACSQGELQEINGIGPKRAAEAEAYAARAKIRSGLGALPAGYASAWTVAAQEALNEAEEVLDEDPALALVALMEALEALEEDEKASGVKQEHTESAVKTAAEKAEELEEDVESCPRCGWNGSGEPERATEWLVTVPDTDEAMKVCRKCAQAMVQLSGYECEGLDLHRCACGEPVDRLAESGTARKLGHLAGTCQLCEAKSLAEKGVPVPYKHDVPARVIWFDGDEKPYGFLSCVGIREQVFVHQNQVRTDLVEGQKVHIVRVIATPRGLQAQDVRTVRMSGTVKWFDHSKNYGWITTEDVDLFVHASQVNGASLWRGDKVEFGVAKSDKGWQAVRVAILEKAAQQAEESSEAAEKPEGTPARGKLKWFNDHKGFGFVERDSVVSEAGAKVQEGENDVFFARQHISGDFELEEGLPVAFQLVWSEDGKPQARNVQELAVEEESETEELETEPLDIREFVACAREEEHPGWDVRARILIAQAEAAEPESEGLVEAKALMSQEQSRPLRAAKKAAEVIVVKAIATAAAEVISSGYVRSAEAFADAVKAARQASFEQNVPEEAVLEAQKQAIRMLEIASEKREVSYEGLRELFEALEGARARAEERVLAGDDPVSEQVEAAVAQEQEEPSLVSDHAVLDRLQQMPFGPEVSEESVESGEQSLEEMEESGPSVGEQLCELLIELSGSIRSYPELHEDYVILAQEIEARNGDLSSEELPVFLDRARSISERLDEAEAAEMKSFVSEVAAQEGVPRHVVEGNGKVPIQNKRQRSEMTLELA